MLALCVLGPSALIFFVVVAGHVTAARKAFRPAVRVTLALVHAVAFGILAILANRWGGHDMLRCGIVGCIKGIVDTAKKR
eukprot:257149-Prymnesium_polylepis.1